MSEVIEIDRNKNRSMINKFKQIDRKENENN